MQNSKHDVLNYTLISHKCEVRKNILNEHLVPFVELTSNIPLFLFWLQLLCVSAH
jgi:hypothetical protein